jgi:hypothetical protein
MIQKIDFRPGIMRENTDYANTGGWYDADKVRFRAGHPEKIGGWEAVTREPFLGSCRALHQWSSIEFDRYISLGTDMKLYILWGNVYYDITPIRLTVPALPANPFTTWQVPDILKVNVPNHGMTLPGDFVTFSNVTTNVGPPPPAPPPPTITPDMLNREFQVQTIIDIDNFTIQVAGAAFTATGVSGGGPAVQAVFQIPTGLNDAVVGTGWGIPPWGGDVPGILPPADKTGWGISFDPRLLNPVGYDVNQIRLWDMDNFGEDLVSNIRHGPIYYWHQAQGVNMPALPLNQEVTVGGITFTPNEVPATADQIIVSPNDRHLIAFGCEDVAQVVADPLLVRWSSEEDAYDWEPRRDNSAGGQRLSAGSYIINGLRTRQEILIWTDLALWSMKYIGTPYIFGFDVIAEGLSIIGPNAAINAGNMLFWMDRGIFYSYTGQVQELPCTIKDYVFSNFNYIQQYKVCAGHNHSFSEVIWFYPTADSDEVNRYVIYNYVDQTWSIGALERTAWLDMGRSSYPIAASAIQHLLYYHELGDDDDGNPMPAYVESSDLDANGGDHFLFLGRMLPDVAFRGSSATQTVGITVLKRNGALGPKEVASRFMVTPNTQQAFIRVRARQISVRVESDALGVGWRLGTLRGDLQPDGQR